jgi:hypothetical protein
MVHLAAYRLVGHQDPSFRQQILNIPEAQDKSDIEPDRLLGNLGTEAIAAIADLDHLFAFPKSTFSQGIEIGPGGVRIGDNHGRGGVLSAAGM